MDEVEYAAWIRLEKMLCAENPARQVTDEQLAQMFPPPKDTEDEEVLGDGNYKSDLEGNAKPSSTSGGPKDDRDAPGSDDENGSKTHSDYGLISRQNSEEANELLNFKIFGSPEKRLETVGEVEEGDEGDDVDVTTPKIATGHIYTQTNDSDNSGSSNEAVEAEIAASDEEVDGEEGVMVNTPNNLEAAFNEGENSPSRDSDDLVDM